MADNATNPRGGFEAGRGTTQHTGSSTHTGSSSQSGSSTIEQAKEFAGDMSRRAGEAVSNIKDRAGDLASDMGRKVTETYEAGRDYVRERGMSGLADDAAEVVRRNPIPSVLIGFGLGFLLGCMRRD
jgi:ElaB/YqjD/DUF883 family membrane-anchored ribosome-binding protein